MQFEAVVETKAMLAAVRRATSLISRSTIPVLGYLKLAASGDRLVVSGTNLDCWLDTSFEAEASGAILVPGKDLESALAVLPSGAQASLKVEKNRLEISCARTRLDLPTMAPADWPVGEEPKNPAKLSVAAKDFLGCFDALRNAICADPNRYYLTGIFLDFPNGRMVACNGIVLGWEPSCWTITSDAAPRPVIVPGDILAPLKKLLDGVEECDVLIDAEARKIKFAHDGQSLTSKLVDGQFPDYERVVPSRHQQVFRVVREDLGASLKRVAWMADDKNKLVKMRFDGAELNMAARTNEVNGGSSEDACAARLISGSGEMEIGMNAAQLAWAIESLPVSEAVEIQLVDPKTAISMVNHGDTNRNSLRILMPVAL